MSEVRTDEEKAQMYAAMLGGANVITSVLDADNDYYNDMTNEERKSYALCWLPRVWGCPQRLGQRGLYCY
jgi:hypothetical protein